MLFIFLCVTFSQQNKSEKYITSITIEEASYWALGDQSKWKKLKIDFGTSSTAPVAADQRCAKTCSSSFAQHSGCWKPFGERRWSAPSQQLGLLWWLWLLWHKWLLVCHPLLKLLMIELLLMLEFKPGHFLLADELLIDLLLRLLLLLLLFSGYCLRLLLLLLLMLLLMRQEHVIQYDDFLVLLVTRPTTGELLLVVLEEAAFCLEQEVDWTGINQCLKAGNGLVGPSLGGT